MTAYRPRHSTTKARPEQLTVDQTVSILSGQVLADVVSYHDPRIFDRNHREDERIRAGAVRLA